MRLRPFIVALLSTCTWQTHLHSAHDGVAFFEREVRPLLIKHCYECHSEESGKRKGGLWLDRREGWQAGGDSGPALVPGRASDSLLVHAVRYGEQTLQMPPQGRLQAGEIAILERWVALGAPDPRDESLANAPRQEGIDYETARQTWAFRSHRSVSPPPVRDPGWLRNSLDAFILSRIEETGLSPAADASPTSLLRRLHYDLTGLPPSPSEMDAFQRDPSPAHWAAIVDDLLHRSTFGEKWGRHWLDVARYADSNGGDRNFTFFQAWRYRNYVIESFNEDRSYYRFVQEQLAGDLMPWTTEEERRRQLIASTFLALGPKMLTERDKEKLRLDTADEQLDTVGRALLGLALGCARCHDHKFDPVSQEDYYALAGIFRSTQVVLGTRNGCVNVASWVEMPLPLPEPRRSELESRVQRLELAMRLTVEQGFRKTAGGLMAAGELPLAGIIYDDSSAELRGEWTSSSHSPHRYGPGYLHDGASGKGEKSAIFRASLPENGTYEVRLAYSADPQRASRIPITVEAWDGIHHVTLDETAPPTIGGLFQPIGRFRFEKGGRANVIVSTEGTEGRYVIVDAVQFIDLEDLDRERSALAVLGNNAEDPLFRMNEGELKKELGSMIKGLREADLAMAPRDASDAGDIHLRVRGEPGQMGSLIPRGFPRVLHDDPPPQIPEGESGRLQLAQWISSPSNALLDRVMVNRIWYHLLGRGIVETVDDFGSLGSPPTHPELLDYLAAEFRSQGGSVKHLVRLIVLSRTYQLGANAPEPLLTKDPKNVLFARHDRRRLTAEELRDSLLWLAGQLDPAPGAATATRFGEDLDGAVSLSKERLRTVYLPVPRNNLVPELAAFDAANPDLVTGSRPLTTVPTQSLYLWNSGFVLEQARTLGQSALRTGSSPEDRVDWLFETILFRPPSPTERRSVFEFFQDLGALQPKQDESALHTHLAHLLLASAEFLFLD